MPDSRRHRGAHPADEELFAAEHGASLRLAVGELSWLLTRGYNETSALKLVGDRHALTARQRKAVSRCACSDEQREGRRERQVPLSSVGGATLAIDGFNLLITLESALSRGLLLHGRDGAWRDLASIHGTYRSVSETDEALTRLGALLEQAQPREVRWLLDRPVSNSGRLRRRIEDLAEARAWPWTVELHDNPDVPLRELRGALVVSADSWILDGCEAWVDLVSPLLGTLPGPWCLELGES